VGRGDPVPPRPTLSLRDARITSLIWATRYSFDHDWLHAPCFEANGEPAQHRGVTSVGGLYFLGLHWMHTFKSGTFLGIGADAEHVAIFAGVTSGSNGAPPAPASECPPRRWGAKATVVGRLR
jgi:hypothetical protein